MITKGFLQGAEIEGFVSEFASTFQTTKLRPDTLKQAKGILSRTFDKNSDAQLSLDEIKAGCKRVFAMLKQTNSFISALARLEEELDKDAVQDRKAAVKAKYGGECEVCPAPECANVGLFTCSTCAKTRCAQHHACFAKDHIVTMVTSLPQSHQTEVLQQNEMMKSFQLTKDTSAKFKCSSIQEFGLICAILSLYCPQLTHLTVLGSEKNAFWTTQGGRSSLSNLLSSRASTLTSLTLTGHYVAK